MRKLEPAELMRHADALATSLEDECPMVRFDTVSVLHHLGARLGGAEPRDLRCIGAFGDEFGEHLKQAPLTQHAALALRLEDSDDDVRNKALAVLRALPCAIIRDIDFLALDSRSVRLKLLGRMAWYKCKLRLRVRCLALYWYARPYRPGGPGHARDLAVWGRMVEGAGDGGPASIIECRVHSLEAKLQAVLEQNEKLLALLNSRATDNAGCSSL